jgi:polysaccharide pyruvyl transferase WcaK-like protein
MFQQSFNTCVFGASPGTGNQGVNALCWSTLTGLAERGCNELHVFDYGREARPAALGTVPYTLHGMTIGKRVWQANHLGRARLAATLGLRENVVVKAVAEADLVLDASGGDSFTDLYGAARFRQIVAPKQIALDMGRPLVLLPQTYGPFARASSRRVARRVIAGARLAYARDPDSYLRLQELLGDRFDPARHRPGIDLAFGLKPSVPDALEPAVKRMLAARGAHRLVGLNISGLIANRPQEAASRFDLACDYNALMRELVVWFLEKTDVRLLLVPHVHAPTGHYESDLDAAQSLLDGLPPGVSRSAADRIAVVSQALDARELKWLIAQTDWFCGTRMHSTVAALSSGVATAALAYSLKTRGVFATCAMADSVVDMRASTGPEALARLQQLWARRRCDAANLARHLPRVGQAAARQLDEIVGMASCEEVVAQTLSC